MPTCSHKECKEKAVAKYFALNPNLPTMKTCKKHEERHRNAYYMKVEEYGRLKVMEEQ